MASAVEFDDVDEVCNETYMPSVATRLQRADIDTQRTEDRAAAGLIDRVAGVLAQAARRNYVDGYPSLLGIDRLTLDGVAVIPVDGRSVTVRTTDDPRRC